MGAALMATHHLLGLSGRAVPWQGPHVFRAGGLKLLFLLSRGERESGAGPWWVGQRPSKGPASLHRASLTILDQNSWGALVVPFFRVCGGETPFPPDGLLLCLACGWRGNLRPVAGMRGGDSSSEAQEPGVKLATSQWSSTNTGLQPHQEQAETPPSAKCLP